MCVLMLLQSGTTGRCYLTNQLLLGQTVLVSALVLPCQQRFLSCIIVMQKFFGGTNKVHYGRCTSGVIGHFFFLCPVTVLEVFAIVNSAQFNFLLVSDVALLH